MRLIVHNGGGTAVLGYCTLLYVTRAMILGNNESMNSESCH